MDNYTLNELSNELDISVKILENHIKKGKLHATRIDRTYWVTSSDADKFLETDVTLQPRNYLCQNYDKCLNIASHENNNFLCKGCRRFIRAEKQLLTPADFEGMLNLWGAVFNEERIPAC